MSRKPTPWFLPTAATTLTALTALTAAPAWADPTINPTPIGPNQYFYGEVNDHTGKATILVDCHGPVFPRLSGHPEPNQTVKVLPAPSPTSTVGFTGSAAHTIDVRFPDPTATPVILRDYAVPAMIPTSLTFPCVGSGTVAFVPDPTSPTARTSTVTVTFLSPP
jgi:hypothetical protein